ncbi:hypothetical protein TspCOW1_29680 [Thiohalobacter sp. COW1]|uniref:hypothetical protein n=1 Tax=Thiohalobacter sp. COW1 TaxID=2795687 RepID=UPI001915008F|nr:hypothetical protein [Thiohalobacter sp. COW1]BCO32865.1 hypothetical protein TspCOW1_29680 [Thiohalobacter sp. COW1]
MADPHWTSYVGMAAGAIGAISGVIGGILGIVSYRRINKLKSLDLRLELRKAVKDLYRKHREISELVDYADRSRAAVMAATGRRSSGSMQIWQENIEKDLQYLEGVKDDYPAEEADFTELLPEELESQLIEVHDKEQKLDELASNYKSEIALDDETRRDIRRRHGG